MKPLKYLLTFIILLCLLYLVDTIVSPTKSIGEGLLQVLNSFKQWAKNGLLLDAIYTLYRVMLGFLLALGLGIIIGMLTGRYNKVSSGVVNIFNYLRAITPVALAPFFLVSFGISETSKILLITWGAFFPIWISGHLGIKALSEELIASAKLQGLSGFNLIKHFYLPATFLSAYTGARVAIGISFILVYISETLGADYGIGYQLKVSYDTFQIDKMTVALLLLGAFGLLLDRIFVVVVRVLVPWVNFDKA
ncbi:ABC transporter permease [Tenacibaculum agarivorans]|uniref:ABC transporter permease n=1 Tax=Tenacibaculum agarivorans TaxID=1908389 RepID=UPI00094BB0DF|nr:ABC transporter permease subunit [Tenacibaculum agarivorans]